MENDLSSIGFRYGSDILLSVLRTFVLVVFDQLEVAAHLIRGQFLIPGLYGLIDAPMGLGGLAVIVLPLKETHAQLQDQAVDEVQHTGKNGVVAGIGEADVKLHVCLIVGCVGLQPLHRAAQPFQILLRCTAAGGIASLSRLPGFAMHMVFAILMGVNLGLARYAKLHGGSAGKHIFLGLFLPVLWHTIYDAATTFNAGFDSTDENVQVAATVISLIVTVASTVLQFVLLVRFKNNAVKYSEMVY